MAGAPLTKQLQPGDVGFEPDTFASALEHCWRLGVEDITSSPQAVATARNRRAIIERSPLHRWN